MKKLTALFVMLVMMFTMAACGDGSSSSNPTTTTTTNGTNNNTPANVTAKEVYEAAEAAMKEVKNYTVKTTSAVVTSTDESSSTTATAYVDVEGKKSLMTIDADGIEMTTYYDDTVYMMDVGGISKLKAPMDAEVLASLVSSESTSAGLSFDDFVSCEVTASGTDYVLTVKGLKETEAVAALVGDVAGEADAEVDLANIEMTMVVDKDSHYKSIELKLSMTVDMGKVNMEPVTSDISVKMEFSNIGSSADKVVKPSEEGYTDVDLSTLLGE